MKHEGALTVVPVSFMWQSEDELTVQFSSVLKTYFRLL